jgi:hypothetical protein
MALVMFLEVEAWFVVMVVVVVVVVVVFRQ